MVMEYYVIKPLPILEDNSMYKRGFELLKYNTNKQISSIGNVYETKEGSFISDDLGFKKHKNEKVSRRIRIVKKHLELKEPKFSAYWFNKNKVEFFKV